MGMVYAPKQPRQLLTDRHEIQMRRTLSGDDVAFDALKQDFVVPVEFTDKPFYPIPGDRVADLSADGDTYPCGTIRPPVDDQKITAGKFFPFCANSNKLGPLS